jgi:hypothetical protein
LTLATAIAIPIRSLAAPRRFGKDPAIDIDLQVVGANTHAAIAQLGAEYLVSCPIAFFEITRRVEVEFGSERQIAEGASQFDLESAALRPNENDDGARIDYFEVAHVALAKAVGDTTSAINCGSIVDRVACTARD